MARLPIRPPPDDGADEHDEDRAFAVQEPDGEEDGAGVKEEKTDLVPGDVVEKADDSRAEEREAEQRSLGLGAAVLGEGHPEKEGSIKSRFKASSCSPRRRGNRRSESSLEAKIMPKPVKNL